MSNEIQKNLIRGVLLTAVVIQTGLCLNEGVNYIIKINNQPPQPYPKQCFDGVDNDKDGWIDSIDPQCGQWPDNSEYSR